MWNEINNQNELNSFMEMLDNFHDSCLKEFKYISGAYVQEDLSMYPINDQRKLKMIIQRQCENPSVVEMEFLGLRHLNIFPIDESYTCEIFGATVILKDDCIYWCDCDDLSQNDLDSYKGTLICASRVRWRFADEYIGKEEVYKG